MKKLLSRIIGIGLLLFLTTTICLAQKHVVTYQGSAFRGRTSSDDWHHTDGFAYKPNSPGVLDCTINFPDFKKRMRIKNLYISCYDTTSTGSIFFHLFKKDKIGEKDITVATVSSGDANASGFTYLTIPGSQMTDPIIDNRRYSWCIAASFSQAGNSLQIHSIRIEFK